MSADRFQWLAALPAHSFSISHNDHRAIYETPSGHIESLGDYFEGTPPEVIARMIESDSIWTLQVYPNSPVGFNVYHADTLESVIDAAMAGEGT